MNETCDGAKTLYEIPPTCVSGFTLALWQLLGFVVDDVVGWDSVHLSFR